VHRLLSEPRRLFRRYIVEDLPFAVRLMVSAARSRLGR
jgi:N-acetylglucosaminyldiphosphoundecaprenol N-acetyl-beta-D-mannosaminyltransferase